MKCVCATIVVVEKQYYIFWVCVCSLSYPACNVNVPFCQLWPVWLYVFPHYLINGTIKKKLLAIKCEFWFSLQLLSETFLILRRNKWDMFKNIHGGTQTKTRFFHERLIYLKNYKKFISCFQSTLHWMICTYPISVSTVRNIPGTPQGGCSSALLLKLR